MYEIAETAAKLQTAETMRLARAAQNTAQMCMTPPKDGTVQEAVALASATVERAAQMQQNWMKAWFGWATYAQSLQGADTVPKFVERSGNIVLQAQSQMMQQANEMTELMENAGVSYAYWVSRQLERD
jgi:hypothetical protein